MPKTDTPTLDMTAWNIAVIWNTGHVSSTYMRGSEADARDATAEAMKPGILGHGRTAMICTMTRAGGEPIIAHVDMDFGERLDSYLNDPLPPAGPQPVAPAPTEYAVSITDGRGGIMDGWEAATSLGAALRRASNRREVIRRRETRPYGVVESYTAHYHNPGEGHWYVDVQSARMAEGMAVTA